MYVFYIKYLGLYVEGIFKVSPSHRQLVEVVEKLNNHENVDFSECESVHIAAAVIKKYFRELPEPLIPKDM